MMLKIKSDECLQIFKDTIYLRGRRKDLDDNTVTDEAYTHSHSVEYIKDINDAIKDWAVNWAGWGNSYFDNDAEYFEAAMPPASGTDMLLESARLNEEVEQLKKENEELKSHISNIMQTNTELYDKLKYIKQYGLDNPMKVDIYGE